VPSNQKQPKRYNSIADYRMGKEAAPYKPIDKNAKQVPIKCMKHIQAFGEYVAELRPKLGLIGDKTSSMMSACKAIDKEFTNISLRVVRMCKGEGGMWDFRIEVRAVFTEKKPKYVLIVSTRYMNTREYMEDTPDDFGICEDIFHKGDIILFRTYTQLDFLKLHLEDCIAGNPVQTANGWKMPIGSEDNALATLLDEIKDWQDNPE